jgi:hypothetical protein
MSFESVLTASGAAYAPAQAAGLDAAARTARPREARVGGW